MHRNLITSSFIQSHSRILCFHDEMRWSWAAVEVQQENERAKNIKQKPVEGNELQDQTF